MIKLPALLSALVIGTAVTACHNPVSTVQPAAATVSAPDLQQKLDALQIAARGPKTGYSADRFPHWSKQPGRGCDTREAVLKRDGRDVRTDDTCKPISGTWTSPYDGETWTKVSDVDIDHVVPRAHAWMTGAASWSQQQREAFANDLTRPELVTVTDNVNQSKGDKAPDQWKPPAVAAWCGYASNWVTVKHHYRLTITAAEKAALVLMINKCGKGT